LTTIARATISSTAAKSPSGAAWMTTKRSPSQRSARPASPAARVSRCANDFSTRSQAIGPWFAFSSAKRSTSPTMIRTLRPRLNASSRKTLARLRPAGPVPQPGQAVAFGTQPFLIVVGLHLGRQRLDVAQQLRGRIGAGNVDALHRFALDVRIEQTDGAVERRQQPIQSPQREPQPRTSSDASSRNSVKTLIRPAPSTIASSVKNSGTANATPTTANSFPR
jgi:hypothetical protein